MYIKHKLSILLLTLTALVHLPTMSMEDKRTKKGKQPTQPPQSFHGEKIVLLDFFFSESHSDDDQAHSVKKDCKKTTALAGEMATLAVHETHPKPTRVFLNSAGREFTPVPNKSFAYLAPSTVPAQTMTPLIAQKQPSLPKPVVLEDYNSDDEAAAATQKKSLTQKK